MYFFFFQAEDGIRDYKVTGVQTCALPIFESGGTEKASIIKTHHNRVAGIQQLLASKRIVEPLSAFYKDEVREIGRELGISEDVLGRHPFPGPGLAIRCLCAEHDEPLARVDEGFVIPIRWVGVQGDSRAYAPVLALDVFPAAGLQDRATELITSTRGINRVVARSCNPAAGNTSSASTGAYVRES